MRKIAESFRGHYRELILGPLFKLFEAVLELMVPLVMAGIIDLGIARGDRSYIVSRGLLLVLLALLGGAAGITCQYFAARVAGHVGRSLRGQTFRHVLALSGQDVAPFGAGGLITRLTGDVGQIQSGINMAIRLASRVPFLAIGSILLALRVNLRIGLIFLVSTPVIVLVLYLIMRRTLPSYGHIQAGQDQLSRLSEENLSGARVIRAFSRQAEETGDFEASAEDLTRRTVRVGRISAALNPLTTVIVNLAIIAILFLGARQVFSGGLLTGEVIALVNYMNQTLLALIVAANLVVLFTRALASTRRVAAVLDLSPSIAPAADGDASVSAFLPGAPAAEMEHVSFAYYAGAGDALESVSFTIPQGSWTGLIGSTGSGKTTLIQLLMRFFDVDRGVVRLGGTDVRAWDPQALRSEVGLSPQRAVLFAGTIRENLRMSAPEADDAALWHALEVAQAADFVRDMRGALDSLVEEGGKNLSGGQRQRLTIARALARRPRLLILDDSSSALDYATDAALRSALMAERRERPELSLLMISQRAASIRHADQILVLDDGRLVGRGTHDVLLRENPVYREICASQGTLPPDGEGAGV